jgi:hypothetical protein
MSRSLDLLGLVHAVANGGSARVNDRRTNGRI